MAKVSRESRGGAAARPAHRRILVLLAPIPPKIPRRSRTDASRAFRKHEPSFFANSPLPLPRMRRGIEISARGGERIN